MNADKLNKALSNVENALCECRCIERSEEGYRNAREYVLDAAGELADLLELEADSLASRKERNLL